MGLLSFADALLKKSPIQLPRKQGWSSAKETGVRCGKRQVILHYVGEYYYGSACITMRTRIIMCARIYGTLR
jgi:hypothetical protein